MPAAVGLKNQGNTCFMNAALQCMAAVKPLTSFILGQSCGLKGRKLKNFNYNRTKNLRPIA